MMIDWIKMNRRRYVASSEKARATVERDSGGWSATITDLDGREVAVRSFTLRSSARRWAEEML